MPRAQTATDKHHLPARPHPDDKHRLHQHPPNPNNHTPHPGPPMGPPPRGVSPRPRLCETPRGENIQRGRGHYPPRLHRPHPLAYGAPVGGSGEGERAGRWRRAGRSSSSQFSYWETSTRKCSPLFGSLGTRTSPLKLQARADPSRGRLKRGEVRTSLGGGRIGGELPLCFYTNLFQNA